MSARILVVGSVMMDLILQMERMALPGESLIGRTYSNAGGGKGANAAVASARLGAQVSLYGTVGTDNQGESLLTMLSATGIDLSHLARTDRASTGLAVILLEADGTNRLVVYPGANLETSPAGLDAAFAPGFDALMMQLEVPLETNVAAFERARAKGLVTCLDAGPAQAYPLERFQGLTILSPNETETQALTGIFPRDTASFVAASRRLQERSRCRFVVLKLGAQGAFVWGDGLEALVPAYPVNCLDPTAAGDCFTGALVSCYAESGDLLASVKYANAAAAVSVQSLGAQPSLPSADAVAAFLAARATSSTARR